MISLGARLLVLLSTGVVALGVSGHATAAGGAELLVALKSHLVAARSLPAGSRPAPPVRDLSPLVGLRQDEVLRALGPPTYCEPREPVICNHAVSAVYEWGPKPLAPKHDTAGNTEVITIITGGPFLLMVNFERGRVEAAYWQGQR
jgi:hypothetical protein